MITPFQSSKRILDLLGDTKVIPVLVIHDASNAGELAKVLVGCGLPILEVTLRTEAALDVMEAMAKVEGAIVGAGTVLTEQNILDSQAAGAQFAVSPGFTESLIHSACENDLPLLPGSATASEMMQLSELGFHFLKFFPAGINGGVAALKSFASPLSELKFCPTGGVNTDNLNDYLSLPNVVCAGGSWLVSQNELENNDWKSVEVKAKAIQSLIN